MPPIRSGPDALHLQVTLDTAQQSYLRKEDIGEIQGAFVPIMGILLKFKYCVSFSFDFLSFVMSRKICVHHLCCATSVLYNRLRFRRFFLSFILSKSENEEKTHTIYSLVGRERERKKRRNI